MLLFTAENAEYAEKVFIIIFLLCDLCALCGEKNILPENVKLSQLNHYGSGRKNQIFLKMGLKNPGIYDIKIYEK